MTSVEDRRATLIQRIARDPYAADVLAELVTVEILLGELDRQRLRDLRRLSQPLAEVLARLADRPKRLSRRENVYLIGTPSEEQLALLDQGLSFLASKEAKPGALLVEFAVGPAVPSFTHVAGPDFAYICLGAWDDGSALPSIVHELAHSCFVFGCRYLDEGVARYFELSALGADFAALERTVRGAGAAMLRLRPLLVYPAADDPYFSRLALEGRTLVHDHGALFVRRVLERFGTPGLIRMCRELRELDLDESVAEQVEAFMGASLEQLDPGVDAGGLEPEAAGGLPADYVDSVKRAMIRLDHGSIAEVRRDLERRVRLDTTTDPVALEAWARGLIYELLRRAWKGDVEASEIAVAEAALERLGKVRPRDATFLTLQTLLAIAHLGQVENEMTGLARLAGVTAGFEEAIRLEPGNIEARYQQARLTLLTPDGYAGSKSAAFRQLAELISDPEFGSDVRAGLTRSGWIDEVTAQVALPDVARA